MSGRHQHAHRHLHRHAHTAGEAWAATPRIERSLWVAVAAWGAIVLLGLVLLWPGDRGDRSTAYDDEVRVAAVVRSIEIAPCTGTDAADLIDCRVLRLTVTGGPTAGEEAVLEQAVESGGVRTPRVGDEVLLYVAEYPDGRTVYTFADYERSTGMLVLALLFGLAVVLLGRWRGVGALAGLTVSVAVLVVFVLPALLDGSNPVLVAIVGASVIAFASLYLAHGVGSATNVALLSTLLSLSFTGFLAWAFVRITTLTGLGDENALLLQSLGVSIDPRGLLLAGVVIGSLGVLDDVTVTQVSAVGQLHEAKPSASAAELYRSAVRIGRDHISSTVNTLFLAYAGAALPLLLLFTEVRQSITSVATREVVAVEIVRTLVGSIGLVASVPISTALAALVLTRRTHPPNFGDEVS